MSTNRHTQRRTGGVLGAAEPLIEHLRAEREAGRTLPGEAHLVRLLVRLRAQRGAPCPAAPPQVTSTQPAELG